jgi:hypothetical protein
MLTGPSTAAANGYPALEALLTTMRECRACEGHLPLGPRPVLRAPAAKRLGYGIGPLVGELNR